VELSQDTIPICKTRMWRWWQTDLSGILFSF